MSRLRWRGLIAVAVAAAAWCGTVQTARAGIWENIPFGLGYAGFDIQGQHNYLSGGNDYRITTIFQGNPLDMGFAELTLQGPISLDVSTGGRLVNELEIHFQTAPDSGFTSSPLNYLLEVDVGNQTTRISGDLLIDGDLTINAYGFYDLTLTYFSRQTVTQQGVLSDSTTDNDFDIGPINVSGNIYADALAVLLDPFFDRAGTKNPFAALSGKQQFESAVAKAAVDQDDDLWLGEEEPLGDELSVLVMSAVVDGMLGGDMASESSFAVAEAANLGGVIPEPSTVIFMLLGAPFIASKRLRDRVFGRR